MRLALSFALLSCTVGVVAAPLRFARSGEVLGSAEIQVHPGDSWRDALRNTPLPQGVRARTAPGSRLEIEMDDGSVLRLAADSLAELSDYTQLSTGQRISLLSLDHGTFHFTARPNTRDSLSVVIPGAQITIHQRARLRFELSSDTAEIAVLEGQVRFATPSAELDLREGQLIHLTIGRANRFQLLREIPPLESDDWSLKRDTAQEGCYSTKHFPGFRFGGLDLDLAGSWLQTDDAGLVWKPKTEDTWAPFRNGSWRWYDEIGYMWIAAEPWGWAPYHFGRWLQHAALGWVWSPGASAVFKPGEVYWLRSAGVALWGALAPDEQWSGAVPAQQFAALNTTSAKFEPGQREVDPSVDFPRPKDWWANAKFTVALPSPPLAALRLDQLNPPLQTAGLGAISFSAPATAVPGASFEPRPVSQPSATIEPPRPSPTRVVVVDRPVYVEVSEPVEIYFPVPVYSGVVVLNPPVAAAPKSSAAPAPAPAPPHSKKKPGSKPEDPDPLSPPATEKPSAP